MISVLIITHDEQANLPSCLESVKWSDDIVVFDSFSSDATVEIARQYGARIFQRKFDNERCQRSASIQVPFKYPWVYNPDADEVTTPELRDEMLAIANDPNRKEAAFRVRFKLMFMNRWIKYSSIYPSWVVRLFRPDKLSFERDINLRYVIDGAEGRLKQHFLHYSFRKGIPAWWEKHNRYSTAEAREAIRSMNRPIDWKGMLARDTIRRRAALKDMSFRLPWRGTLILCYLLFARGGILDGPPGWHYCRMRAYYEFLISVKIKELRRREKGLTI